MDLIGIIDGGSTKTDFIFIDTAEGKVLCKTKTIGFNPLLIEKDEILKHLHLNQDLKNIATQVKRIFYYGAGSQTPRLQKILYAVLHQFFTQANIQVDSDMTAAAFAVYHGKPTLVGILGTGCNTCFFDGKTIQKPNPSLGYVIGDEGSGNHIGKNLLRSFYAGKFPDELQQKFSQKYNLNVEDLLASVYQKPSANAYLASFASFAVEHKKHPYIENLVSECFQEFFEYQVYPYHPYEYKEVNFIGSIAHYFKDILSAVAKNNNLMIGQVVQKPIEKLVEYHIQYLI